MTRSGLRTITITAVTMALTGLAALAALAASPATSGAPRAGGSVHAPDMCTSFADPGDGACEEWPGDPDGG